MSILDPRSVTIKIATLAETGNPRLQLDDRGKIYDLVQAFAAPKLEKAQLKLQQLVDRAGNVAIESNPDRYLLVREGDYYSVWELDRSQVAIAEPNPDILAPQVTAVGEFNLPLQQASFWLFQELWVQWEDLLGTQQLQVFSDLLIAAIPRLQNRADIERILTSDPRSTDRWEAWADEDSIALIKELFHLNLKKLGHQFGTQITIEILRSLPNSLSAIVTNILGL
jgi:hypothetical protein